MSYNLITAQGFESDNTPFTLTGTMARSAVSPLAGTYSLRGGNGLAVDGQAVWTLPTASRPSGGSRAGLRLDVRFKFARGTATTPTGGTLSVLRIDGSAGSFIVLDIATATDKLHLSNVTGTTALGTGTHSIYMDFRQERGASGWGYWARVYLDGALEISVRRIGFDAIQDAVVQILLGVGASGKCTWDARWDDITVKVAYDPQ